MWIGDLFNSWVGDANLDGEFNSGDLVVVLASGAYEQDVTAVWESGDFNGAKQILNEAKGATSAPEKEE